MRADRAAGVIIGVLFWTLALLCCAYATALGGRDGRRAVGLVLAASLLTIPAERLGYAWGQTEGALLLVDGLLLVGLYVLMLSSRRFFPIWMVGFHLITVTTHLSTIITPDISPRLYRAMESLWAIPVLVSMVAGIMRDRRAGLHLAR